MTTETPILNDHKQSCDSASAEDKCACVMPSASKFAAGKAENPANAQRRVRCFTINNTFTMIVILTTERRKNLIRNNEEIFHFVQDDKS